MNYTYIEKYPSADEYNLLRSKVGWNTYNTQSIDNSISKSLYIICVYNELEIIGMGRIVGDDELCLYIQDIIVIPEYQNKGIGNQIMQRVMNYINKKATNNTIIGLMSSVGKEKFYEKYGFIKRPNDKHGCGMTIFYKKN
jgi:ribosomal protein S18 acetylase RimI-like enzyme